MNSPLLSIVIASYNSEKYIVDCLESLRAEIDDRVEVLLMDGGSSDHTMQIVAKYPDLFAKVVSEPDTGQSNAFNKGFEQANGTYFTWLNSDDVLCPGSLKIVLDQIEKTKQKWYAANVVYVDEHSSIMRCCQSGSFETFAMRFGILNVFGPSTIFHRELYTEAGGFREDFHYGMDTEYWWRLARLGYKYERVHVYLWALRLHEEAKTASAITEGEEHRPDRMKEEGVLLHDLYYPNVSRLMKQLGVFLIRLYRISNFSYIKSFMDTKRYVGKSLKEVFCGR